MSSRLLTVPRHHPRFSRPIAALAVVLLGLQTLGLVLLQVVPGFTMRQRTGLDGVASLVMGLALTLAALQVSRDGEVDRETRGAWRWISLAFLCQWVGNDWWWSPEAFRPLSPVVSGSDAISLLFYPLFLVGVLRYPHPQRTREDSARYWLDVAIVTVSGGITIWFFTQVGDAVPGEPFPKAIVAIAHPLCDVLALVALAVLGIRSAWDTHRRPLRYLAAAMVLALVAEVLQGTWIKAGMSQSGGVLDVVRAASATCLALAVWSEGADIARNAVRVSLPTFLAKPTYLAYGSSSLLFGVLFIVAYATGSNEVLVLVIGAAAIMTLTILRQVVAVRENVRLSTEAKALEGEARFRALVQHSSDVIFIVDVDSTIRFVSPAAFEVLGCKDTVLLGQRLVDIVHPEDTAHVMRLLSQAAVDAQDAPRGECRLRHGDDRWVLMEHVATNLLEERLVNGIVLNSRDVTEREELQCRLTHQAFHDPLTNLANRTLFGDRASHAMKRSSRDLTQVALLFIDIDDFKKVNDSLGHATGDAFLVAVSERLRGTLRDGDTLARLGGDEFGLLLEDCGGMGQANDVAERVRRSLRDPIALQGRDIFARVSVGIASAADASSPAELMRNADLAMYIAKARGKGGSVGYEPRMHADIVMRLELEADLRHAIERGELSLVYQPIVTLETLELRGVESLLRWTHPRLGEISPGTFIPIAEEAGLIGAIGKWALREAAGQARRWRDTTGVPIHVGVNISGRQIQGGRLLDDVREAVRDAGIEASQLLLEITESTLMHHGDEVLDVLRGLRATGVSLALDDFGTGYSSLSYLQRFPIDILKIDKTFIEGMATEGADPRLVRAIIALGESLDLKTIAEGVETEDQWRELRALGCAMGQGYLFARPLPPEQISAVIRDGLPEFAASTSSAPPAAA